VPIIFVTAISKEDQYVFEGYESGAVDYLFKPLNAEVVKSKVRIFVELYEQRRDLREAHADLEQAFSELDKKNRQIQEDLRLAHSIQTALLPHRAPVFPPSASPEESALNFFHRYVPIAELGGDFFDVHAVSEDEAFVLICDVMGHGVQAALMTAVIRGLVERLKATAGDPAALLTEINRSLVEVLDRPLEPVLTTAFCLTINVRSGVVRATAAGHPTPYHLHRREETLDLMSLSEGPGPALGLAPDTTYEVSETLLEPGDLLLLYTDGLFEVDGKSGEQLGGEGLEEIVRQHLKRPPTELLDAVLKDVKAYSSEHGFDDDICFVGMEFVHSV
jgi:serine phosphatase RsbU (regulator of sigma subunit)